MISGTLFTPELRDDRGSIPALQIFALAVLLRMAVWVGAYVFRDLSLVEWANHGDGVSYIENALAMAGRHPELDGYRGRVFPGYSMLLAPLGFLGRRAVEVGAVLINWVAAGGAAVAAASFLRDRRAGWALATLPPTWLMFTTMVKNEAVWLLLITWGVLFCLEGRLLFSAVLIGFSGVVRPWSCFVEIALLYWLWNRETGERALQHGALAAATVVAGLLSAEWMAGAGFDFLTSYSGTDYKSDVFAWPFESVVMTPLETGVPAWKVVYIWGYVALSLIAIGFYVKEWGAGDGEPDYFRRTLGIWLASTVLFVSTIGHIYGFHEFDRFSFGALPALMFPFLPLLPDNRLFWLGAGSLSCVVAVLGVTLL